MQSDGSLDKLNFRIVVRADLQNKEMVWDTYSPTALMRTLKYFLSDDFNQKKGTLIVFHWSIPKGQCKTHIFLS